MKRLATLAFGLLALAAPAHAQAEPPLYPASHLTFDCPPGPGYLLVTAYDVWDVATGRWAEYVRRSIWVGSAETCRAQADALTATRSTVHNPTLFAVCAGQDAVYYLKRWSVGGQRFAYKGDVYYGAYDACMRAATQTNSLP